MEIPTPAWADVIEVDRFDDPFPAQACDGGTPMDCSLREAVINANSNVGPDLIVIPAGLSSLTRSGSGEDAALTGDLDVTDAVRIEGAGEGLTIIDGGGPGGLDDRIFHITASEVEMEVWFAKTPSGAPEAEGERQATVSMRRSG